MQSMKRFLLMLVVMVVAVTLTSCGNSDNGLYPFQEETKYLTVRLQGSDKWSIINIEDGKIIAKDAISGDPSAVHEDMFYVYDNETARINYYNVNNCSKPINSKPYSSATSFNGGYAVACLPGEDLQVIDKNCQTVKKLPPSIASASLFLNERALVRDDRDLFGYIDTKGDTVIAPQLGLANAFVFNDATLVSESEVADTTAISSLIVIDKSGKKLFGFGQNKYTPHDRYFINGTLKVLKGDTIVYLDKNGNETSDTIVMPKKIKDTNYRDVRSVGEGRYMVIKGDRMGLVNEDNEPLIKIDYSYITNITPNRFVVGMDSVMMLVDENGKQVGNAKFIDFKSSNIFEEAAGRGYINTAKVAAAILQLIDKDAVFNVRKGATLMELNQMVGMNPENYIGLADISVPLPPLIVTYHFDREIASSKARVAPVANDSIPTSAVPTESSAQFNYTAAVRGVTLQYPVRECAPGTEEEILQIITQQMGSRGFGINGDGTFTSDDGCVVVMGHDKGVFQLNYYFDTSNIKPLQRVSRNI